MYARFYRWASDRLGDEGLVAFVTNSSFLHARTFDGFRKRVAQDFSEAWVIDLKGNARNSGEQRRREGGNIFEDKIKVGVAIAFFVRRRDKRTFTLKYLVVDDYVREDDKREFVARLELTRDRFTTIRPAGNGDWLNQQEASEWDEFLPIADKKTKGAKDRRNEKSIFKFFTLGAVTARDDWVFVTQRNDLDARLRYFVSEYEKAQNRLPPGDRATRLAAILAPEKYSADAIKFTRALKKNLAAKRRPLPALSPSSTPPASLGSSGSRHNKRLQILEDLAACVQHPQGF